MGLECKDADGLAFMQGDVHGNGFTLVELLVTLSVVAILLTIAPPFFRELIANQRVQTGAMDLYTGLVRARSEAVKQNLDVTLSSASGGTNWAAGWKIATVSADLDKHGASANVVMTGSAATVTYRPSGHITATTAPTFAISADGTTAVRCVTVDLSGQPYVTKTTCS